MRGAPRADSGKCCAFKVKKKNLAQQSLRSSVLLVTPKFRENHGGRRGEREKTTSFITTGSWIRTRQSWRATKLCAGLNRSRPEGGGGGGGVMSAQWREEDDEEYKVGGGRGGSRSKPRFSFTEIKLLLEEVKRNRYIILKKFNHGVSAESKKQTWAEITDQINDLGENRREVRQIMKKWADLKCDGKRRMVALRGPNGTTLRKKNLGPVERMVHKILLLSPGGEGDSDLDFDEDSEDLTKRRCKGRPPPPFSYLSMTDTNPLPLPGGASFDLSPLSSPEKDLSRDPFHSSPDFEFDLAEEAERAIDFDDDDDDADSMISYRSSFPPPSSAPLDCLPDNALLRTRPVHTYSRNNSNHTSSRPPPGPSCSSSSASNSSIFPSTSDSDPPSSSAVPPQPQSPSNTNSSSILAASLAVPPSAANGPTSHPVPSSSSSIPPPSYSAAASSSSVASPPCSSSSSSFPPPPLPPPYPSSTSHRPLPSSSSSSLLPPNRPSTSDPLPAGASSGRTQHHVAQLASQSLQQQQASRMLLASVSQSLEVLAQSVQLLVESQQEFVQESLLLQRETVDILRDFSNTALAMLREKSNSGQVAAQQPPPAALQF